MKLSKFSKKVIAIVMALAMVAVGNYFMPATKSVDADHSQQYFGGICLLSQK